MNASELTGEQAIANYRRWCEQTGRTPVWDMPLVRTMLPVLDHQVSYWAGTVVCPCCEDLKRQSPRYQGPRRVRWVDAFHQDYGECRSCLLPLVPEGQPVGERCATHRRWLDEQATKRRAAR
jgi:hypothetical protein